MTESVIDHAGPCDRVAAHVLDMHWGCDRRSQRSGSRRRLEAADSLHGSNLEPLMSALGHVWTAPPWQELSD